MSEYHQPPSDDDSEVTTGGGVYSLRRVCPVASHKTPRYDTRFSNYSSRAQRVPKSLERKKVQGKLMKKLSMCKRTCKYGPRLKTGYCPRKRTRKH